MVRLGCSGGSQNKETYRKSVDTSLEARLVYVGTRKQTTTMITPPKSEPHVHQSRTYNGPEYGVKKNNNHQVVYETNNRPKHSPRANIVGGNELKPETLYEPRTFMTSCV